MNLSVDQIYKVKVIKIIKAGVIVELEDKSTQLIHISNIANNYIASIDAYVSVGDVFDAMAVPSTVKGVELSLKHLKLKNRDPEVEAASEVHKRSNREPRTKETSKIVSDVRSREPSKKSVDAMLADLRNQDDGEFDYHRRNKANRNNRRQANKRNRR